MTHSISSKDKNIEKPNKKAKNIVRDLANSIPKTIKHFFPRFLQELRRIEDYRKKSNYELE